MKINWSKVGKAVKTGVKVASVVIEAAGDYADDGKRNHSNKKPTTTE